MNLYNLFWAAFWIAAFVMLSRSIRSSLAASRKASNLGLLEDYPAGVCVALYRFDDRDVPKVAVSLRQASGVWQFPGGKLEEGETPLEAAQREVKEETGIELEEGQLIFHQVLGPMVGYSGEKYVRFFFVAELSTGQHPTNPEPEKHSEWYWVGEEQLKGLNMLPLTKEQWFAFSSSP